MKYYSNFKITDHSTIMLQSLFVILIALLLFSCSSERQEGDVEKFFEKGGRVGYSPDVGLYKLSLLRNEWDYVATMHGMEDDMDFCEKIVNGLQLQFTNEKYSCRILNE